MEFNTFKESLASSDFSKLLKMPSEFIRRHLSVIRPSVLGLGLLMGAVNLNFESDPKSLSISGDTNSEVSNKTAGGSCDSVPAEIFRIDSIAFPQSGGVLYASDPYYRNYNTGTLLDTEREYQTYLDLENNRFRSLGAQGVLNFPVFATQGGNDSCSLDWGSFQPFPVSLSRSYCFDSLSGDFHSDSGPYHLFGGNYLGDCVDSDLGDLQNSSATADDLSIGTQIVGTCAVPGDDDDGIVFTSDFEPGRSTSLDVTASGSGFLNGWVDFNQDGDFLDINEQIFTDEAVSGGVNSLSFLIPITSLPEVTFARFRMDSGGGLTSNSSAPDGEIEDYQIQIENFVTVSTLTDASEPTTDGEAIIDLGILNPGPGSVDITYSFTGGTALSGIDFSNATTTLSIPSGSQTGTIIVPIIDDAILEGSETIEITLTSTSLGVLPNDGSEVFTLTILDNELSSVSGHGGCASCHNVKKSLPKIETFMTRPVDLEKFLPCKYDGQKDIYKDFSDAQFGDLVARDAFQNLYRLFAINGKENGRLEIGSYVTRAESVKILYSTSGCDRKDFELESSHYNDVQSSSWQNFYVGLGTKDNVMQGYGDGTFRPNQSISRSEFLKIVLLSMGYTLNDIMSIELNSETQFLDTSNDLSDWQLKFAQFGKEIGLVNGYASGAFGFNNPISRGEAAIIIEKAFVKEIETIVKEVK